MSAVASNSPLSAELNYTKPKRCFAACAPNQLDKVVENIII